MASKYYKSTKLSMTGVLEMNDGELTIDIEGIDSPVLISSALADFVGGEITLNISEKDEF